MDQNTIEYRQRLAGLPRGLLARLAAGVELHVYEARRVDSSTPSPPGARSDG